MSYVDHIKVFLLVKYLEVNLLGYSIYIYTYNTFSSGRYEIIFSRIVISIYTPTRVYESQLLLIFAVFLILAILGFVVASIMTNEIEHLLHIYWLFRYPLWRSTYSNLLSIFLLGILPFKIDLWVFFIYLDVSSVEDKNCEKKRPNGNSTAEKYITDIRKSINRFIIILETSEERNQRYIRE